MTKSTNCLIEMFNHISIALYFHSIVINFKMKVSEQVHLRERVNLMIGHYPKSEIARHFMKENVSKSTIYAIIKRLEDGKGTHQKPKTGRPRILNSQQRRVLKKSAVNKLGVSQRKLAKKIRCFQDMHPGKFGKDGCTTLQETKSSKIHRTPAHCYPEKLQKTGPFVSS